MPTKKKVQRKVPVKRRRHRTHILAPSTVELVVSESCRHGCFAIATSMPSVWRYPAKEPFHCVANGDVIFHTHQRPQKGLEDLDEAKECFNECWEDEDDV